MWKLIVSNVEGNRTFMKRSTHEMTYDLIQDLNIKLLLEIICKYPGDALEIF